MGENNGGCHQEPNLWKTRNRFSCSVDSHCMLKVQTDNRSAKLNTLIFRTGKRSCLLLKPSLLWFREEWLKDSNTWDFPLAGPREKSMPSCAYDQFSALEDRRIWWYLVAVIGAVPSSTHWACSQCRILFADFYAGPQSLTCNSTAKRFSQFIRQQVLKLG